MGPVNPPLASDPLRSVGLVAIPAGAERELLFNQHTGAARLLSYEDGDILELCRSFRTAAEHARLICAEAGLPPEHQTAITSQISLMARAGLFVRKSDLLDRLAAPPPAAAPLDALHPLPADGARFNAVLDAARGRRILFDDGPLLGPPSAGAAFVSEDVDLNPPGPWGPSPAATAAAHAALLGLTTAQAAGKGVDLDGLDAALLRRLRLGDGRVAVTQHGRLAPDGRARGVARLSFTRRPFLLGGPIGLDLGLLLPPAPPVEVGFLDVFLLLVQKIHERAIFALLPGVTAGPALPRPTPLRTRLADLLLVLIAPLEIGPAKPDGAPRLKAVAAHLRSAAALDAADFRALVRPLLRARAAAALADGVLPVEPLRAALASPDVDLPEDAPDARAAVFSYAQLLEEAASR